MCNCGSGSSSSFTPASVPNRQSRSSIPPSNDSCNYNDDMLLDFKSRLVWFKANGRYVQYGIKPSLINRYIGIVLTSLNSNFKCTYATTLDAISDLANFIISIQ